MSAEFSPSSLASNSAASSESLPKEVVGQVPAAPRKAAPTRPNEIIELVWFDPLAPARIRSRWSDLMLELDFEALDPRHDLPSDKPEDEKNRHDVFGVLTEGTPIDSGGVAQAIRDSINDKGRFTPPLVLVSGELRFPFDELETLKATITAISPMMGSDKKLKESIDAVNELLKTPYLQSSTGVVEKLTQQLIDQFFQTNRSLPRAYLDEHTERMVLLQRRYQIRKVFGEEWIRALLSSGAQQEGALLVYLPKKLENTLPMMTRMKVRLIAEAHMQQDQYESSSYALRASALGRVISFEALGQKGKVK